MKNLLNSLYIFFIAVCIIFPTKILLANEDSSLNLEEIESDIFENDGYSESDFFKLEESIVVAASKHTQIVSEAPATVYTFDSKLIKILGFTELTDIFPFTPGIDYYNPEMHALGGQRGFILGTGIFEKSLILLDGVEVGLLTNYSAPLNHIKRIEVIQGPASALYGADAMGGIINLVSNDYKESKGININVNYGSYNTLKPSLSYNSVYKKLKIKVFGRMLFTDGPNYYKEVNNYKMFAPGLSNSNKESRLINKENDYKDPGNNRYLYTKLDALVKYKNRI